MGFLVRESVAQVTVTLIICKMGAGVANEGVILTRRAGERKAEDKKAETAEILGASLAGGGAGQV
jgi:hypothetical protein